ncbi:MAG: MmcQ/YjbR family DNA-binding protein [Roseobacter sp.]|jgi:predicted DNA-binding protein (MmcQ/YjbR family)|nr:MmcQ/YjbR family DNA-binding protein [Roseobacter sp.]
MSVTRAQIDSICQVLPEATLAYPPELVSWKVGGKMFACFGGEGEMQGVSVKTQSGEAAAMLIEVGAAIKAPYFHRSWVRMPFNSTVLEEATHRLHQSYDIIRRTLPKAMRDSLTTRSGG